MHTTSGKLSDYLSDIPWKNSQSSPAGLTKQESQIVLCQPSQSLHVPTNSTLEDKLLLFLPDRGIKGITIIHGMA